jgi:hypothetical protein
LSFREFSRLLLVPLALLIASVVVTLAVVEVGLRLVAPSENIAKVEYEPLRGWRGAVSASFTFEDDPVRMEVAQNSRGYRDLERTEENPDGAERILCCGDSFTWGWGVEQDSIYTRVLEDACRGERMEYWEEQCSEVDAHFILDYLVRQQEVRGTPAFIPGDGHWTTAAHRWIADYLHDLVPRDTQAAGETAADRGRATGPGS